MKNKFKYVEYNKDCTLRNKFKILSVEELAGKQGFRSTYQFDAAGAAWITNNGGVAGFGGTDFPVWNEQLYIEFDDNKLASKELFEKLKKMGIGFELYESGNRSYHFHINREIEPSHNVPYTDKLFVSDFAPDSDASLYKHLQPWRLEGTLHKKTGKPKKLLRVNKGKPLELELKKKSSSIIYTPQGESVFDDDMILAFSTIGAKEGSRNKVLSSLAIKLVNKNVPLEVMEWWMKEVNQRCDPPCEEAEIDAIIKSITGGKHGYR